MPLGTHERHSGKYGDPERVGHPPAREQLVLQSRYQTTRNYKK